MRYPISVYLNKPTQEKKTITKYTLIHTNLDFNKTLSQMELQGVNFEGK